MDTNVNEIFVSASYLEWSIINIHILAMPWFTTHFKIIVFKAGNATAEKSQEN